MGYTIGDLTPGMRVSFNAGLDDMVGTVLETYNSVVGDRAVLAIGCYTSSVMHGIDPDLIPPSTVTVLIEQITLIHR
jgi:hypothetical protein